MHHSIAGHLPAIFWNVERLYEGTLWHYLPQVLEAPNRTNGYHNARHTLHVLWLGYEAIRFHRAELNPRRARNLLVAILKHDHGHSGKPTTEVPDETNLQVAEADLRTSAAPEDASHLDEIAAIMWATCFPHRHLDVPSLEQRIIRDVDLCQALHPAWFEMICLGLGREWGKTPLEMLEAQVPFLRSLRFETGWAKATFPAHLLNEKVTEVNGLLFGLRSVR